MTTSSFFFGTTAAGCPCPEGGEEEDGDDPLATDPVDEDDPLDGEDDPLDEDDPVDEGAAGVTTCEATG